MFRRARATTAACLALAAAVLARAAEPPPQRPSDETGDEVVRLHSYTVEGDEVAGWNADPLETAGLGAATAAASPTLSSALGGLPGLVLQDGFGGIDPPRLTIRGSGLQSAPVSRGVVWMLDGLPLNAADGSFNSALVAPELAARAALLRDFTAPAAGTLALGGAIALESPGATDPSGASLAVGGHGTARGVLSSALGAGEGRLGVSAFRTDGWREQSAQERVALSGRYTWRPGETGPRLGLGIYAANPRFDVPGPLTLAAAQGAPESVSAATAADRPRRETGFVRASGDATWSDDSGGTLRIAVAAQYSDDLFRQLRANGIAENRGADFTALIEAGRVFGAHSLRAGVLALDGRRDQERFANLAGGRGPHFADVELQARTVGAWLDDRWRLGPALVLDGGLSLGDARRESGGSPSAATGLVSSAGVAPRLALRWRPTEKRDLELFATASRAWEPPTFDDLLAVRSAAPDLSLAWTSLRAQRSDTAEVGLRGGAKNFRAELVAYAARWNGELLRLADAGGAALGTVNAGRSAHRGIEAALRWRLRDGPRPLELALTHTWSDARFDDDPVFGDNHLAGLPPHAGSLALSSVPESGWFGVLGATWIGGRTFADHANRLSYGGHCLVNARTGWAGQGWSIFLEIDNALDSRHIASTAGILDIARASAATAVFLPGSPRTFSAGLARRW